jgi:hypothetical protein
MSSSHSTIRSWLEEQGFDWDSGVIVYQWREGGEFAPGWSTPDSSRQLDFTDPILDTRFCTGHGGPMAPRFFAKDRTAVYFPGQYDGATWCEKVVTDPKWYLDPANKTPYPGG